ncbi:probable carboxylesterase 17 [Rhodamnia argentea]|uniref:Probable carboxylesterase 17 n=1 Tax=Rhodamnia argentea TaxID=178133 RepID=A0A8B8PHS9_9MYRT|nr:probable carboxylesterase 17 [Rhodamnia argentea]
MSIDAEMPVFLRVLSDGSIKRFVPEIAPASNDSSAGYFSKDVVIDTSKPITARIFIPNAPATSSARLPVLAYFHGGGFCIGSTTWLGYHHFLGDLCLVAQCIVFSVDYRLAPENRLPVAYEDCYASLEWLSRSNGTDPWLKRSDLSRLFLSGDSAGANIAHHVVIRALQDATCPMSIAGLMSIHPYFGSKRRTEKELADEGGKNVGSNDLFWRLSIPEGSDRDYPGCNFEMARMSADEWRRFPPVVVHVAELDFLKERGMMYAEFLKGRVKEVELVEAKGEQHVYHVFHPKSEATSLLHKQMSHFMKRF